MVAAKLLTKKEKAWLGRLEKVLMACPTDRLECYTVGDNDLMFYDKNVHAAHEKTRGYREEQDMCPACDECGAHLGRVFSKCFIVSAAG